MRKLFVSTALAASLVLASCATDPSTGVTTVSPSFVGSVQAIASTACSIIPTVDSILAIFNAGLGATATAVANAICSAAPPKASARFRSIPLRAQSNVPGVIGTVNGILVTGWRAGAVKFGKRRG